MKKLILIITIILTLFVYIPTATVGILITGEVDNPMEEDHYIVISTDTYSPDIRKYSVVKATVLPPERRAELKEGDYVIYWPTISDGTITEVIDQVREKVEGGVMVGVSGDDFLTRIKTTRVTHTVTGIYNFMAPWVFILVSDWGVWAILGSLLILLVLLIVGISKKEKETKWLVKK